MMSLHGVRRCRLVVDPIEWMGLGGYDAAASREEKLLTEGCVHALTLWLVSMQVSSEHIVE